MYVKENSRKLASYIKGLPNFEFRKEMELNDHLGATLTDVMFQAGVNYNACVLPRVQEIKKHINAATISGLIAFFKRHDAETFFNWKGRKPRNLLNIISFLEKQHVETEDDLKRWLNLAGNVEKLKMQPGFGNKTVDYLKILVGFPNVAVDRHIITMLERAGIYTDDYTEAKEIVIQASEILGVNASVLDHSIWNYISASGEESQVEIVVSSRSDLEKELHMHARDLSDDDLRKIIAQIKAISEL